MGAPARHPYLDQLRGGAILAVILLHVGGICPGLPGPVVELLYSGQFGVQLFFVVSAVTLMMSWHARQDAATSFYLRRLFRILPMWLLAVAAWTILRGMGPSVWAPSGLAPFDIAAAVLLLHGWVPNAINAVVPGGWSIAAEATFYLVFPLFAATVTNVPRAIALVIAAILLELVLEPAVAPLLAGLPVSVRANFFYYWFPNQAVAFAFGILAYFVIGTVTGRRRIGAALATVAGALLIALPLTTSWGGAAVYGAVFFVLVVGVAGLRGSAPLHPSPLGWMGERSYSAYFWQFPAILGAGLITLPDPIANFSIRTLLVLLLTFAASHLSFTFIERPGIAIGRRLGRRSHNTSPAPDRAGATATPARLTP